MIISISWKNVWRNRSRSMVVLIAVTLGTVAGIFVAGLMNGWVNQRVNSAIYTENGHLKIQNPQFLVNEEAVYSINYIDSIFAALDAMDEVKAYTATTKIVAMATTARGNAGIMLRGINVDKQKSVSDVYSLIIPGTGSWFASKTKLPQVVISDKTAEQLRIKNYRVTQKTIDTLRVLNVSKSLIESVESIKNKRFITKKKFESAIADIWSSPDIKEFGHVVMLTSLYYQPRARITFSFTKVDGQIGYLTYQVGGIYKTSNTAFDQFAAFVKHSGLAGAAGLEQSQFHEISVVLNNNGSALATVLTKLKKRFPGQSIMSWKQIAPDAGMMADFMTVYYYIIMGIIFFALAFGIINTMLMAIMERVRELGMLMAIGMKKAQVFGMIMLETVFLTLTGSVAGMVIGAVLIRVTGQTGLNFSSVAEGFEAMGWAAIVYPTIDISFFFGVTVMVVVVAMLSSIIPARRALKLKPIEALRME